MVMLAVVKVGEDVMFLCKSSNGREIGYNGYIYVSLSSSYIPIGVDGEAQEKVRGSSMPMHLLPTLLQWRWMRMKRKKVLQKTPNFS